MVTWLDDTPFPSRFDDPDEFDSFLSRPSRTLAADLAAIDGDIIVLGGAVRRWIPRGTKPDRLNLALDFDRANSDGPV